MGFIRSPRFNKNFDRLPKHIQKKAIKALTLLAEDHRHKSLRVRKMRGLDVYEARIDIHYRFTYNVMENDIHLLTIGMHDEGLGVK